MYLNFFPIEFDLKEFQILAIEEQEGLLNELRNKYNATHSFFKRGNKIYISNKSGEDLGVGEIEVIQLSNNEITSSLIKHVFFKTMLEKYPSLRPVDFYPFIIQASKNESDLLFDLLPIDLKGKIGYVKYIVVQLREIEIGGQNVFGFTINIERNWKFQIPSSILHAEGFSLVGAEVIHSVPIQGLEGILLPDETLVGVVTEIRENQAVVQTNDDEQLYNLSELYLRKSNKNVLNYLSFKIGKNLAINIFEKLKVKRSSAFKLPAKDKEIQYAAKILFHERDNSKTLFMNKDGFCFKVNVSPKLNYNSINFEEPVFVFDPSRTKTSKSPDIGLINYGAYDSNTFSPKTPKVIFICHSENRGHATSFAKELIEGIPNSDYFKKGLLKKYDLQSIDLKFKEVASYALNQYEAISKALVEAPDLLIISIPEEFKETKDPSLSLYYQLKSHFLRIGIPLQFVTVGNLKKYDEYKLNAIALQCYAKLGGIPWTILAKQSFDKELVIGIGHSIIRQNQFSGNYQERVVGITTFFSSDGQYLLGNKVKDVPFEDYFTELLSSLKESIEKLEQDNGWKSGDTIRLIFHIFKPIKEVEFLVVKELIKQFSRFNIQFAFVTISEFHPFVMIDENQQGKPNKYNANDKIGLYVPYRGANIVLDKSSCLIQTLGVEQMRTSKFGSSSPLLIKIRQPNQNNEIFDEVENLLFADLHYISNQIYKFTYLSWRGFMPNLKPATMLYSFLISNLLGKLRKVSGWQPESVNFHLKFKKWFL